jgi:hypothetical protein
MRKNEAQQGFQPKNRIKKLCKELVPLNTKAGFFLPKLSGLEGCLNIKTEVIAKTMPVKSKKVIVCGNLPLCL